MENKELNLKLTVAQVNTILKHLGQGIYSEVVEVINNLHTQSVAQLQASKDSFIEEEIEE